jgi:RimJ/RimL family protein N-acetyltransferase
LEFAIEFESSTFIFNPICTDDAVALFSTVSSEEFPSSLFLAKIETLEQAKSWCLDRISDWETGKCYVWTCCLSSDLVVVGQVTLLPRDDCLALAYWVKPAFWGQGVATQMCKSLLFHIYSTGYRGTIWAGVNSWNTRSSSVLETLGFKAIDSGGECTEYCWEIVF